MQPASSRIPTLANAYAERLLWLNGPDWTRRRWANHVFVYGNARKHLELTSTPQGCCCQLCSSSIIPGPSHIKFVDSKPQKTLLKWRTGEKYSSRYSILHLECTHLTLTYISQTPSVVVQQVSHCTNILVLFANHFSYYVFIFHMVAWYWWWAEGVVLHIASFWRWRLVEGVVCCRVSSLDWQNSDSTG